MYPIIDIKKRDNLEPLGTKEKFWYHDNEHDVDNLFKVGRPGTGENWAEKVTSEIAKLLSLPCATYDFARWEEKDGVVSPSFVPNNGRLIHGNELLDKIIEDYPGQQTYKVKEYKLLTVLALMKQIEATVNLPINYNGDENISKPLDLFIGYLMFDCWISNPDRHHENWGIVSDSIRGTVHLAPTYDHASGLGCRAPDEERAKRLTSKDKRYTVMSFVERGKSAFIDKDQKPIKTLDAFKIAAKKNPNAANAWLDKLNKVSFDDIDLIFNNIPEDLISKHGIRFAKKLLLVNKDRLLSSRESVKNE